MAVEVAILEGAFLSTFAEDAAFGEIVGRLVRMGDAVPAGVELGYHLCYGDLGHEHFKQPRSLELAVRLVNAVAAEVSHPVAWVHMPVPVDRQDDAYFEALSDLRVGEGTELYLGVVHHDGLEATQARIEACERVLGSTRGFGVATECGMGRTPPEEIEELLRIHAEARTGRAVA